MPSGYTPPPLNNSKEIDMNEHNEEGVSLAENKQRVYAHGLTTEEATQLLFKYGRNELEDKKKSKVMICIYIII